MTKKLSRTKWQNVVVTRSDYSHIPAGTKGVALWNRKLQRFEVTITNCPHPMAGQSYYNGRNNGEATYAFKEEYLKLDEPKPANNP